MRLKHLILFCLLLLFAGVRGFAAKVEIGGLYYNLTVSSKTAELTSPTSGKYSNVNVDIPMSVSYNNATYSVTSIGSSAFNGCTNLTRITIPNSVKTIGDFAFKDCSSLLEIKIPEGVTSINRYAFSYCSSLTKIIIPNSVTVIGENAFWGCKSLTDLPIGNGVTTIGDYAFSSCTGLTEVTIPSCVTSIGTSIFNLCHLERIKVEQGNTKYDSREDCNAIIQTDGNKLIVGCGNTIIPNSVESIGDYAFANYEDLFSISIPSGVSYVGNGAFMGCSNLKNMIIPNNVTYVGYSVFMGCSSLTSVFFGDNVEDIKSEIFIGCTSLTVVIIGKSITEISYNIFKDCSALKEIICRAATPPTCSSDILEPLDKSLYTIYVPVGSLNTYKDADIWGTYQDNITDHVSIPLGDTGYATYCSHADLNFSEISDYQACIIDKYYKEDESYVVLTPVDKMQYGTGFLLKGEPNTICSVPFVINAYTYDDTNLLIGTFEEQDLPQATGDGKTNYILANGIKGLGFYKSSGVGNIAAHKAYLHLSEEDAANINMLLIGGNGNTTGIEQTIQETMPQHNEIYNLNGQRVENPQHGGIYIIGGKKIIY